MMKGESCDGKNRCRQVVFGILIKIFIVYSPFVVYVLSNFVQKVIIQCNPVCVFSTNHDKVQKVGFSNNANKVLYSVSRDGALRFYDLISCLELNVYYPHGINTYVKKVFVENNCVWTYGDDENLVKTNTHLGPMDAYTLNADVVKSMDSMLVVKDKLLFSDSGELKALNLGSGVNNKQVLNCFEQSPMLFPINDTTFACFEGNRTLEIRDVQTLSIINSIHASGNLKAGKINECVNKIESGCLITLDNVGNVISWSLLKGNTDIKFVNKNSYFKTLSGDGTKIAVFKCGGIPMFWKTISVSIYDINNKEVTFEYSDRLIRPISALSLNDTGCTLLVGEFSLPKNGDHLRRNDLRVYGFR